VSAETLPSVVGRTFGSEAAFSTATARLPVAVTRRRGSVYVARVLVSRSRKYGWLHARVCHGCVRSRRTRSYGVSRNRLRRSVGQLPAYRPNVVLTSSDARFRACRGRRQAARGCQVLR
jgi:hypothetical protein